MSATMLTPAEDIPRSGGEEFGMDDDPEENDKDVRFYMRLVFFKVRALGVDDDKFLTQFLRSKIVCTECPSMLSALASLS